MSDTDTQTDITDDSDSAAKFDAADVQKAAASTPNDSAAAPNSNTPEQLPSWDDVEKQHSQPEKLPTWEDVEANENPSMGTAFGNLAKAELNMFTPTLTKDTAGAEELSDAQRVWAMSGPIGHISKAFGAMYSDNQEIDPEVNDALKGAGIQKSYRASEDTANKSFMDGTIIPAARGLGLVAMGDSMIGAFGQTTDKFAQDIAENEGPGVGPAIRRTIDRIVAPVAAFGSAGMAEVGSLTNAADKVVSGVASGFGVNTGEDPISGAMEALGGDAGLFHMELPEGTPEPLPVQLDRATANGTTLSEGIWDGTQQPTPAQVQVMQEAASRLPPTPELHVDVPIPEEEPAPSIHDVARQIDPETFAQYDQLNHERDMYSNMLNTIRDGRRADPAALEAEAPHTQKIADLQDKLETASARNAKRYQGQIDDLQAKNQAWISDNLATETPEMAKLREAIQSTDEKIRDVAFDKETGQNKIKAAYDEAAKQVPNEPVAEATPPQEEQNIPIEEEPKAEPSTPAKPIEEQIENIKQGVKKQLIAAGRPEDEAEADATIVAHRYATRSARYGGKNGTAEEMFERDAPLIEAAVERSKSGKQLELAQKDKSVFDLSDNTNNEPFRTNEFGNTKISYDVAEDGSVHVHDIQTPEGLRGQGSARAALTKLLDEADEKGKTVTLDATPLDDKTDPEKLKDFYKSLGFEEGENGQMIREPQSSLAQQAMGKIKLATDSARAVIKLFKSANASTFLHEMGHHWLDEMMRDAAEDGAPDLVKSDVTAIRKWLGDETGPYNGFTRRQHEKFARGFERYLMEGVAPSPALARAFGQFRQWMTDIYKSVSKLRSPITDEVRGVFDRLLAENPEKQPIIAADREPGSAMADIHEADAVNTDPAQAADVRDNIEKEIDLTANQHDPEIANAIKSAESNPEAVSEPVAPAGDTGNGATTEPARDTSTPTEPSPVASGGGNVGGESGTARTEPRPNPTAEPGSGSPTGSDRSTGRSAGDRFVDKAGNIRLENLTNNEDVRSVMRDMADQNFNVFNHAVVTDREVSDLAQAMGVSDKEINLQKLQQAARADGIPLAVRIKVGRQMLVQSAQEAMEAMRKAANGGDAELQALAEARRRHLMIAETVSSITNEWGRAGRAFQDISKDTLQNAETVTDLFQKMTGLTPKQMKQMAEKGDFLLNEPDQALAQQKMAKYLQDSTKPTFGDKIVEYRTNMLISGPITHARYAVGNFINAIWDPLVNTPIAATIGAVREAISGEAAVDRVQFGEIGAQLYAIGKGSTDGLQAAVQAWKDERSPALPGEKLPTDQPVHSGAIGGNLGIAVRIPGRVVGSIHSFFKQLRYEQNIAALSFRQAVSEGLDGDAFHDRIAELTQNPTDEMMQSATSDALKQVYMAPTKYDSFSGRMQAAINKNPIAKCMVPFMKIGTQIESQALLEGTPLGLLNKDIREGMLYKKGGAEGDMAVAKVAAGVGLMGATVLMAAQGHLTGDGPNDPAQRNVWLLNHKPNTIQVGGITIPYKGMGYLGMQMRFAANMYETAHGWNGEDGSKLASSFLEGITRSVLDDNWMYGVKQALDAVYHPTEYGPSFLKNFATSWLPYSVGMHQTAQLVDPYMRDNKTIFDAARANIPFESENLFPRRDAFGNPIPNSGSIEHYANDPVVQRMEALQIGMGKLGQKIRGVPLSEQQYDDYSRLAGRLAKQRLDGIVPQDGFSQMPAENQIKTIKKIVESSRESARSAIMMQNPEIIQKAQALKNKH